MLVLGLLLAAPAAAQGTVRWATEAEFALRYQNYEMGETAESVLAPKAKAGLRAEFDDNLTGALRFEHREDLYNLASSAALGLERFGSGWDFDMEARLERHSPGKLSSPLLFFDPDSLESQSAADADYNRSSFVARLRRPADRWSARLEFEAASTRYDRPAGTLSDIDALRGESGLEILLPAEFRLESELVFERERYGQRAASDADVLALRASLHLPAPPNWELALRGRSETRDVEELDGLSYYERPGGGEIAGGFGLAWFGAAELSLDAFVGSEDWDEYDGYYTGGATWEIEAFEGNAIGEDSRMDLLLRIEGFHPDSLSLDDYTLSRGEEQRWEASLFCQLRRSSVLPLGVGLLAESLRLRGAEEDHFELLQAEAEAGWSPRSQLALRFALRVDRYSSRLGSEPEELEWGIGGDLSLEGDRGSWTWIAELPRRQHVSFLEEAIRSEDWEAGLRIRWHP